jgi:hypothetical protein
MVRYYELETVEMRVKQARLLIETSPQELIKEVVRLLAEQRKEQVLSGFLGWAEGW